MVAELQRLRIKYGKTNLGKFISHLDLLRTWGRVLRRAELPIAYSEGFNPHPKISFGSALAVGVTSEGEYLDIELREELQPELVLERLKEASAPGLEVYDIKEINEKVPSLMAVIDTATYLVKVELTEDIPNHNVNENINKLLANDVLEIMRDGKKGIKPKDIRPGIQMLEAQKVDRNLYVKMVVDCGSSNNIRPNEVIDALSKYTDLPVGIELIDVHRLGLFIKEGSVLKTPLEVIK